MKQYTNEIIHLEKTGKVYRRHNGQLTSTVKATTADGKTSEVSRVNAEGGYRAGSHYAEDEKMLSTAIALCEGAELIDALRANYAKCGIVRRGEMAGTAWYSEFYAKYEGGILYRMTKSAKHETNGWKPAYDCTGRYPQEILQDFNSTKRSASLFGYQTEGEDNSRNASISEAKRKGLLKA